uniref:LY6/PLAUR domain containing 6 n=1 Tax=Oryzias sinensis TaxID=183150 RepID=A0A8C7YRM5_9TELE
FVVINFLTTPHPGGFKCFTCEDAPDNYQCNRWAPDVFCPKGTMYCYTRHMMDDNGGSVSVTKRCATLENCQLTGCVNMCTSCCEGNICNIMVPRNDSSAVFSSTSPLVSSGRGLNPAGLIFFIIVVAWTCLH